MINLTEMEKQALDAITKDDFYDNGLDSAIWADVYLDTFRGYYGVKSEQARGVLASLVKKNIIGPILEGREECVIYFTEYGKEVMKELGYSNE